VTADMEAADVAKAKRRLLVHHPHLLVTPILLILMGGRDKYDFAMPVSVEDMEPASLSDSNALSLSDQVFGTQNGPFCLIDQLTSRDCRFGCSGR
jgi:hypothetical protein